MASWLASKAAQVAEAAKQEAAKLQQDVSDAFDSGGQAANAEGGGPPPEAAARDGGEVPQSLEEELARSRQETQEVREKARALLQKVKQESQRRIDELQQELESTRAASTPPDETGLAEELAEARQKLAAQKEQMSSLQEKARDVVQRVKEKHEAELVELQESHAAELEAARAEATALPGSTDDCVELRAPLDSTRQELARAREEAEKKEAELRQEFDSLQERARGAARRLKEQSEAQLEELRAELAAAREELQAARASAAAAEDASAGETDAQRAREQELEAQLAAMQQEGASQKQLHQQQIETLQEKAKAAVQRLREQGEEREAALRSEAEEARAKLQEVQGSLDAQVAASAQAEAYEVGELREVLRAAEERLEDAGRSSEAREEQLRQEFDELRERLQADLRGAQEQRSASDDAAAAAEKAFGAEREQLEQELQQLRRLQQEHEEQQKLLLRRLEELQEGDGSRELLGGALASARGEAEELRAELATRQEEVQEALSAAREEAAAGAAADAGREHAAQVASLESSLCEAEARLAEVQQRGASDAEAEAERDRHREAADDLRASLQANEESVERLNGELAEAREEHAAQSRSYQEALTSLQEKARATVARMREQEEERVKKLCAELDVARQEGDGSRESLGGALASARGEAEELRAELSTRQEAAQEELEKARQELRTTQEAQRRSARELGQARSECQELLNSMASADAQPAQHASDSRVQELQQLLDHSRLDQQAALQETSALRKELAGSNARCADLHVVVEQRDRQLASSAEELAGLRTELERCREDLQQQEASARAAQEAVQAAEEKEAKAAVTAAEARASAAALTASQERAAEADEALQKARGAHAEELARLRREHDNVCAELRREMRELEMDRGRFSKVSDAQLAPKLEELHGAQEHERQRSREAHEAEVRGARGETDPVGAPLADGHKQLIHALQQRLGELQREAEERTQEAEGLRRELEDMRDRKLSMEASPLHGLVGLGAAVDLLPLPGEAEEPLASSGGTGDEDAAALRERVGALEARCRALQKQLASGQAGLGVQSPPPLPGGGHDGDEPPSPGGPSRRAGSSWEPWLRDTAAPLATRLKLPQGWEQQVGDIAHLAYLLAYYYVDKAMRSVAKGLVKHALLRWVFFGQLLVLYAFSSSCLVVSTEDPLSTMGMEVHQRPASELAAEAAVRKSLRGQG